VRGAQGDGDVMSFDYTQSFDVEESEKQLESAHLL
jgi:hypothetical protein